MRRLSPRPWPSCYRRHAPAHEPSRSQVRMKAPVQEYTVILAQREADFKWGEDADAATVARAARNLERDVAGAGTLERPEAFAVLLALELHWDPQALPCFGTVNRGAPVAPGSAGPSAGGARSLDGAGRRFGWEDLRPDQQQYVAARMRGESEVYAFAGMLARRQETQHREHGPLLRAYSARCAPGGGGQLRITSMKAPARPLSQPRASSGPVEGPSCAIALLPP
jgi:hypothetical protein